jgi:hypothetical protein
MRDIATGLTRTLDEGVGYVDVPMESGLGVTLDFEAVDAQRVRRGWPSSAEEQRLRGHRFML